MANVPVYLLNDRVYVRQLVSIAKVRKPLRAHHSVKESLSFGLYDWVKQHV